MIWIEMIDSYTFQIFASYMLVPCDFHFDESSIYLKGISFKQKRFAAYMVTWAIKLFSE